MKVRELIVELQKADQEARVHLECVICGFNPDPISSVREDMVGEEDPITVFIISDDRASL
jgi:hypothetical protein